MRKPSILFFVLLFISFFSYSQKIIINGKATNRNLVWSDFTGKPDPASPRFAYTWYTIRFNYSDVKFNGDAAIVGKFEVVLELDPQKSWHKPDKISDELLVHEQGHFNIGILCSKEMLAAFKNARLTRSNYAARLQEICTQTMKKYNDLTSQYDEETNHFMNKEQQSKWNEDLTEKLNK